MIEAALQRARDEKPAAITQAHPLVSRRCPGAGASQGHQASSSSHGRFAVSRCRHVARSFKASSPISARTSSRQSNFRVHTFHRAVDTSEAEVAALEEARSRVVRLGARSKMCPDVPMSTATKTGSDVIAELEESKAKLASTERERDEALAAPACKRQAMSCTVMVREGTPTNPRFAPEDCTIGQSQEEELLDAMTVIVRCEPVHAETTNGGSRGDTFTRNRFSPLHTADEAAVSGSDTESDVPVRRRRRLRMIWNEELHQEAHAAMALMQDLAQRVGAIPIGDPIPLSLRSQRVPIERPPHVECTRAGTIHTCARVVGGCSRSHHRTGAVSRRRNSSE